MPREARLGLPWATQTRTEITPEGRGQSYRGMCCCGWVAPSKRDSLPAARRDQAEHRLRCNVKPAHLSVVR